MANELNEVSRLLGNLEASITAMAQRFDKLENRMDERDETLSEMSAALTDSTNDTRYLKEALLKDIKPVTDDVRRWRAMGMGALAIVGIGGAAIGSSVLWLWDNVASRIKWGP